MRLRIKHINTRSPFFKGMGSIFNIAGSMRPVPAKSHRVSDFEAIEDIWYAVGDSIRASMLCYEKEASFKNMEVITNERKLKQSPIGISGRQK